MRCSTLSLWGEDVDSTGSLRACAVLHYSDVSGDELAAVQFLEVRKLHAGLGLVGANSIRRPRVRRGGTNNATLGTTISTLTTIIDDGVYFWQQQGGLSMCHMQAGNARTVAAKAPVLVVNEAA